MLLSVVRKAALLLRASGTSMSDVPLSASELACLLCSWEAADYAGLRRHRLAAHATVITTSALRRELKLPALPSRGASRRRRSSETVDRECNSTGGSSKPPPTGSSESVCVQLCAAAAPMHPDDNNLTVGQCTDGEQGHLGRVSSSLSASLEASIAASVAASRVPAAPLVYRKRKTSTPAAASATPPPAPEFIYTSVSAHARAIYEDNTDTEHAEPLVRERKATRAGLFDTPRLRRLERFVLQAGHGGLSMAEQDELYKVILDLDAPLPDGSAPPRLCDQFKDSSAFKRAVADDLDAAALASGWQKATLVEDGERNYAYFRPVRDVVLSLLDGQRVVQLWSGDGGPAPATDRRESPFDGDAFRACEADVCRRAGKNCVLGLHVFSDSSRLSWSGGTSRLS